MRMKGVEPSRA